MQSKEKDWENEKSELFVKIQQLESERGEKNDEDQLNAISSKYDEIKIEKIDLEEKYKKLKHINKEILKENEILKRNQDGSIKIIENNNKIDFSQKIMELEKELALRNRELEYVQTENETITKSKQFLNEENIFLKSETQVLKIKLDVKKIKLIFYFLLRKLIQKLIIIY